MKAKCLNNRRILVIDDNENIHEDFRAILLGSGGDDESLDKARTAVLGEPPETSAQISFEIDSALQGQEGLEKVLQAQQQGHPYAVAFVDIRMPPGWDGVETIERIWQECPQVEIVICTAYSDYGWHDIVAKLGQTDRLLILKKPFDSVEVYQLASALTEKWYLARRVEGALRTSEAKYQDLYDNAPDMFASVDAKTAKILQCNDTLAAATGYDKEEIIGRPIFDLYHSDCIEDARKAFNSFATKGEVQDAELQVKRKDGSTIDVSLNVSSVRDEQGNILHGRSVWRDITERKLAQKEIETLARFPKENPNPVLRISSDGIVLFANEAGKPVLDTWGTQQGQRVPEDCYKKIREAIESGEPSNFELSCHDGRMLFVTLSPVRESGYVNAYGLDITELKEALNEVSQAKKEAEDASKAKSQFLANMSHEIRTPMNSVLGFSEMLSQEHLTDEQTQYVTFICDSAKNLMEIINDILDFSKIEAGKLDIDVVECVLSEILADVDSMLRPKAREKELEFEILCSDLLPTHIHTDPDRLRQCLINLVNNAIKFTEEGHVHINVSLEYDSDQKPCVHFAIEDTGIGIKPQEREKIFESFAQADTGTTRKYGGTGLGLAITKQLAGLLGGELALSSTEGKGSTFSFVIPAGIDEIEQRHIDRQEIADHTDDTREEVIQPEFHGHVLVAEDVETNQVLVKALLRQMGLKVTIASDGRQAVQKALVQRFDLILMDIQMPKMNGYEAIEAIRKEGIKTPIVALTAHALREDGQKCIDAGCNGYLSKPLDKRRLAEEISRYLPLKDDVLSKQADSVKSQMDELSALCDNQTAHQFSQEKTVKIRDDEEILNWGQLIDRLGDEELIKEVVPMFLNDSRDRLEALTKAVNNGDADAIKLYAHAVRGAGRNVGAKRLPNIAHRLECAGKDNDMEIAAALLDELKNELEKLVTFFSRSDWIEIARQERVITDDTLNLVEQAKAINSERAERK